MIPIFIQGDDMALKYSRQREVIKDCLTNREDHPTADMVYMEVRETFPYPVKISDMPRDLSVEIDARYVFYGVDVLHLQRIFWKI